MLLIIIIIIIIIIITVGICNAPNQSLHMFKAQQRQCKHKNTCKYSVNANQTIIITPFKNNNGKKSETRRETTSY